MRERGGIKEDVYDVLCLEGLNTATFVTQVKKHACHTISNIDQNSFLDENDAVALSHKAVSKKP